MKNTSIADLDTIQTKFETTTKFKDQEERDRFNQEYQYLKDAQQRILQHPQIKSIMKDEQLKGRTLLSKFTILENNFSGLASDHLLTNDFKVKGGVDGKHIEKTEMQDLIQKATHSIREAMFELSKVVDTGEFHTELKEDKLIHLELYPLIPKCFKVDLKEFTSPVQITISYAGDHHQSHEPSRDGS